MRTCLLLSLVVAAALFTTTVQGQDATVVPQPDPAIQNLISGLSAASEASRVKAADELATMGANAAPAIPALVTALSSSDVELRWRAARALGAIGPSAGAAVPDLTKALGDTLPKTRAYAAYALGQIGAASKPAVPAIVKAVTDEDPLVRKGAIVALQSIKPGPEVIIPLVSKALNDAEPSVVMPALHALAEAGEQGVPVLRQALQGTNSRYWACLLVEELGPKAAAAAPEVSNLLKAEEPEIRMQAALALGAIGPTAKSAAPALTQLLDSDPTNGVRYAAAFALGRLGAKEAEPVLRKMVTHEDPFLSMVSAFSLSSLNPNDPVLGQQAITMIVKGLKSDNPTIRSAAARALVEFKGPQELVAPVVISAVEEASPEVIGNIMQILADQGAAAVPRLMRGLANEKLRPYAIQVIGRIGPEAKEAVPALASLLPATDPRQTIEIQLALAAIGPASLPAMPKLIESLKSDNQQIRTSAAFALGKVGPTAAGAATDPLRELLKSEVVFERLAGTWALLKLHPNNEAVAKFAVPYLVHGLAESRPAVRVECVTALGNIGPLAKSSLPEVKKLLQDDTEYVRTAAAEAIKKIDK